MRRSVMLRLAYYIRGQGDPLLLIAGYSQTMGMWDPGLLDELSKSHRSSLIIAA